MTFKKAVKADSKLRLALIGPSGAGKTWTALMVAQGISKRRIAVIDTERGSASKYADQFDFDVLELPKHSPDDYCEAINEAWSSGEYDVLVIDSLSHAWMGRDGALEQVDREAARSNSGSSFAAWRHVTPLHNRLVDTMVQAPLHLVVTMRAKTEWLQEKNERGKTVIRKVGMAAVQRDGLEYEFDVVADMEPDRNVLAVSKTRCQELNGAVIEKPGPEFAETLKRWLDGKVVPFGRAVAAVMAAGSLEELAATAELAKGLSPEDRKKLTPIYATKRDRLTLIAEAAVEESHVGNSQEPDDVVEPDAAADDDLVPPNLMVAKSDQELPEPLLGAFCYVEEREDGRRWLLADVEQQVWRTVRLKKDKAKLRAVVEAASTHRGWDHGKPGQMDIEAIGHQLFAGSA